MNKICKGIKYWMQVFLLIPYGLSFLFPRNKKIWVFGSTFGNRFADNPRYFYLFVSQHKSSEIRPVWIGKNREIIETLQSEGYEAYRLKSVKGIWFCLWAKVYLYDNYPKDICHWTSGGAVKINLWHGIPLKKIQNDNLHDLVRHPESRMQRLRWIPRRLSDEKPSHYILAPSHYFSSIFQSAFQTNNVIVEGYPRTDIFTGNTIKNVLLNKESICLEKITENKDKKILLYMPTFRDSETMFFDKLDLHEFNSFLERNHFFLCVKLHCKSKLNLRFKEIESKSILVIDPSADPHVFINSSDVLITDYSSIYLDYLLTCKPILFFNYDLDEYLKNSRELYFDYEEFTPGYKAMNGVELMELLSRLNEVEQEVYTDKKRKEVCNKSFDGTAKNSSEGLYKSILKILYKEENK
jgi:CDP-glycerol glycerophosphotransferase (TagB/SpsB family)